MTKRSKVARDTALFKLTQKKKTLEKSRQSLIAEIKRIDRKLTQIQADYGEIFNALSPLLSLPTEVTCMIFDYAATHHSLVEPSFGETHLLSEVVISHVCKQWREVALGYPRLWTKFFYNGDDIESSRIPLDRFDAYIKRSASQNLELYLEFREDIRGQKMGPDQLALLDMAITQVARWNIVTLRSDIDTRIESRLAKLERASAPNLEYFALCPDLSLSDALPETVDNLSPSIFKGGAPKLCYLMLDGSTSILPPMSSITTLRIEADDCMPDVLYSWSTFLEILSIPSLANLSLVGNVFVAPENDGVHLIMMNHLKHFRYSDNESMTLLLPHIRAPLLETLSIRNDWMPEEFGSNSGSIPTDPYFFPSLKALTLIDATPSSNAAAWHLMQMTKNAKSILISHDDDTNENLFAALHIHDQFNSECWPKLTSLTVNISAMDDIQVFIDFISARPKDTLTLRVFNDINYAWKAEFPNEYGELKKICTFIVLDPEDRGENALVRPFWPPGGTYPDYTCSHDPFEIETYEI